MAKVILTHEVSGLGRAGDVVDVREGYARNYLLPEGYAMAWTKGGQKQVDQIRQSREAKAMASQEEAANLRDKLEAGPIHVAAKSGKEGKLFGSVTRADIEKAVAAQGLGAIDHRTIDIPHAIKNVGEHKATVSLADGVVAALTLSVVAEK
ncbi:50S ribosomal protein L9 [Pontimonas sp.]|jgi:large subunit ribosomal protein L9|uniref:50S ribosomal protein L9 n=1 Tax=Pontimonas sp. TaxID=2304492 RepID=UPI002870AA9B|nr:50S ribosomal protein L9 [Pontimonas sp.]MDR9396797.1 50S ribosomal protein L9 [Pontimonas sp.]MDR9434225.1 50S ribosomal protein L9 [Pontimonas sp.]